MASERAIQNAIRNALADHGDRGEAYIMFANGITIRGFKIDRQ